MSNDSGCRANVDAAWLRAYAAVAMFPLALAACGGGGGSPPPAPAPTPAAALAVTPSATSTTPDGTAITLQAVVSNSTATPTWTLTGAGTLSATSGASVQYLPPDSEVFDENSTVIVSASISSDVSQNVSITLTPIVVPGFTWTNVVATSVGTLQAVDFADGRYVAVSDQGSALTSTDAVAWTPATVLSSGVSTDHFDATAIVHIGSTFVAAGSVSSAPYTTSTSAIATSADGLTWTMASTPALTVPIHALVADTRVLALGEGGHVYSSPDGKAWSSLAVISGVPTLNASVFGAGKYVAVGDNGYIAYSADGTTWASGQVITVAGLGVDLHGLAYDGKRFVAVGDDGLIATSANGANWTSGTSVVAGALRSVAVSSGGEIVIVGDNGIETSKDAVTWHARDEAGAAALHDVAFLNGQFVAVGAASAIKTSNH
jgi:hypothetical protein